MSLSIWQMSTGVTVHMADECSSYVHSHWFIWEMSARVVVHIAGEGRFRYFDVMGVQLFSSHDM